MAKKEKVIELKNKAEKVSEEHLKELQNIVNAMNNIYYQVGKLEANKHQFLHDLAVTQNKATMMQETLQSEYGNSDINISDGTINWKDNEK